MSMTCDSCTRPTNGVALCSDCRRTTSFALANIAGHYDDLDTLRTGQARYGSSAGGGSVGKERPLGMDIRFTPGGQGAKVQQAVRSAMKDYAGKVHAASQDAHDRPEHDSVRAVCAYLDRSLGTIVTQEWAGDFKADMVSLEKSLVGLVDRPADQWYAGECGWEGGRDADGEPVTCTKVLYAQPGKDNVQCRTCGTEWPVKARRDILVREAEDRQATVRMLARVITTLGASDASEARLEGRINLWVHRGKLTADGTRVVDGKVRSTYRVGAVLDLIAKDVQRETERKERLRREAELDADQLPEATRRETAERVS